MLDQVLTAQAQVSKQLWDQETNSLGWVTMSPEVGDVDKAVQSAINNLKIQKRTPDDDLEVFLNHFKHCQEAQWAAVLIPCLVAQQAM